MTDATAQILEIAKTNQDVGCALQRIYDRFPLDVRFVYGRQWLENHLLDLQNYDHRQSQDSVVEYHGGLMFRELIVLLQGLQENADFVMKSNVERCQKQISTNFGNDMKGFFEHMADCAKRELQVIETYQCKRKQSQLPREDIPTDRSAEMEIFQNLHTSAQYCNDVDKAIQIFAEKQGAFLLEYQRLGDEISSRQQQLMNLPTDVPSAMIVDECQQKQRLQNEQIQENYQHRVSLLEAHKTAVGKVQTNVPKIWEILEKFREDSKLAITGMRNPVPNVLEDLEKWCGLLNSTLVQIRIQAKKIAVLFGQLRYAQPQCNNEDFEQKEVIALEATLEKLLKDHLDKIFIVDRSPPQVLKVITGKSLGFSMSVRILGAKGLGVENCCSLVSAELFKEQAIQDAMIQRQKHRKGECDIQNGKDKPLEYDRDAGVLRCVFNSAQLQKVKALEKGPEKLVTENMHAMIFYTTITVNAQQYNLATMSLPMTLISHVLQDCQARAFLIWDAAFSEPDHKRKPFEHRNEAEWGQVATVLDSLFKMNTGTGLHPAHLHYLARIAFKDKNCTNFTSRKITRNQLLRDKLHKDFSFWKWYYANMNLIKDKLKKEWQDGLIYGFIAKDEIQTKLLDKQPGTFLLRFSERDIENTSRADVCGCLTLAVVEWDPTEKKKKVFHVKEHLTPREISDKSLATILEAFEVIDAETKENKQLLNYLYPDKPFNDTFLKYLVEKRRPDSESGYRQGRLRIQICLFDDPSMFPKNRPICLPASPSTLGPHSPDNMSDVNPESPLDSSAHQGGYNRQSQRNGPGAIAVVTPHNPGNDTNSGDMFDPDQVDLILAQISLDQDIPLEMPLDSGGQGSAIIDSGQSIEHEINSGGQSTAWNEISSAGQPSVAMSM